MPLILTGKGCSTKIQNEIFGEGRGLKEEHGERNTSTSRSRSVEGTHTPDHVPANPAWGLLEGLTALCSVGIHGRDRLDGSKDTEILCLARFRFRAGAKGPRGLGGWDGETACALLGAAIPNSRWLTIPNSGCLTTDGVLFLE
jgi:hypothetical protein